MSDTVTVQQLKHAFVIQLSPQASQIERTNSFNLIQSFKSSPTRDQVKVIFELITDSDSKYPFYQFGHFEPIQALLNMQQWVFYTTLFDSNGKISFQKRLALSEVLF